MRRRYRDGFRLSKSDFAAQPWAAGMLMLEVVEGRQRLGLYVAGPGHVEPPLGLLWHPQLAACAYDTISFSGVEQVGKRFVHQTWYCEIGGPPREPPYFTVSAS